MESEQLQQLQDKDQLMHPLLEKSRTVSQHEHDQFENHIEIPKIHKAPSLIYSIQNRLSDEFDQIPDQPYVRIAQELIQMGFTKAQVNRLICIHKITNLNEAVDLLTPNDQGMYSHMYTPSMHNQDQCQICDQGKESHYSQNQSFLAVQLDTLVRQKSRDNTNQVSFKQNEEEENLQKQYQLQLEAQANDNLCNICYCPMVPNSYLQIPECNHKFCKECVISYLDNLISTRQINKLVCPQYGCGMKLQFKLLESILSLEQLQKYQEFKQDLDVMIDKNKGYCPNPNCNKITTCNKKKSKKNVCEHCKFEFCGKCQISWAQHEGKTCEVVLAQEMGTWFTSSDFSNCPKCHVRVEKVSGCNHMKCPQCSNSWCWICGASCTYAHYLPFNPFGCPGLIITPSRRCSLMTFMIINFLFLPVVMIFYSTFFFATLFTACFVTLQTKCWKSNIFMKIVLVFVYLIEFAIFFPLSVALAVACTAIVIVPAYFFQLYRLIKVISLWGCKSGDKKSEALKNKLEELEV